MGEIEGLEWIGGKEWQIRLRELGQISVMRSHKHVTLMSPTSCFLWGPDHLRAVGGEEGHGWSQRLT